MELFMSARNNDERLAAFREEIERAWMERGDYSVVDRLAAANQDLAEKLYLFFATVVDAPDLLDRRQPELADSARRTREWLEREGFALAARVVQEERAAETTTPENERPVADGPPTRRGTFVGLLRRLTGADPERLAAKLDITQDFLVDLSANVRVLPTKARGELAKRAGKAWGADRARVLASLGEPDVRTAAAEFRRAASRSDAYAMTTLTYEQLVQRSSMDAKRKRYWLKFADG
jgi:hypothetical protein